ncbi:MAG: transposase [Thermodesulfobacteriota bacterium]|nr:transposase [Thermodesulfobacteriota bacterium]
MIFILRRPRIIIPGVPLHLIQHGNNRQSCFYTDEDYCCYLDWLHHYSLDTGGSVHAYVLMTNHVHLLLTPADADSAGMLMKRLGQWYVQYVNRTYQRSECAQRGQA